MSDMSEEDKAIKKAEQRRIKDILAKKEPGEKEEEKEKELADELQESWKKGAKALAMAKGLGIGVGQEVVQKPQESAGFLDQVVEARKQGLAFRAFEESFQGRASSEAPRESGLKIKADFDLNEMVGAEKEMRQKAEASRDEAVTKYWQSQADRMGEQVTQLRQLVEQRFQQQQGQASPFEVYKQVKSEVDEIKKELAGGPPVQGMDSATLIRLKEIEFNQAVALQKMKTEAEDRHDEYLLELRKWDDERKLKWAEFRDKKDTKAKALSELGDLVGSVVEEMEGGEGAGGTDVTKGVAKNALPSVQTFECPTCNTELRAKVGQDKILCPTCGEEHELKWTEG